MTVSVPVFPVLAGTGAFCIAGGVLWLALDRDSAIAPISEKIPIPRAAAMIGGGIAAGVGAAVVWNTNPRAAIPVSDALVNRASQSVFDHLTQRVLVR